MQNLENSIILRFKPKVHSIFIWFFTLFVSIIVCLIVGYKTNYISKESSTSHFFYLIFFGSILGLSSNILNSFGKRFFTKIIVNESGISKIWFSFIVHRASWKEVHIHPLRYFGCNGLFIVWNNKNIWISSENDNYINAVHFIQKMSLLPDGAIGYSSWKKSKLNKKQS